MKSRLPFSFQQLQSIAKGLDTFVVFALSGICVERTWGPIGDLPLGASLPWLLIPFAALCGVHMAEGYRISPTQLAHRHVIQVAIGAGYGLTGGWCLLWLVDASSAVRTVLGLAMISWIVMVTLHAFYAVCVRYLVRSGRLAENIIIVGATPKALDLIQKNAKTREMNIVGIFDDRLTRTPRALAGTPILGKVDDLMHWDRLPDIDRIVVTITSDARVRVKSLVDRLRTLPNQVILLLDWDRLTDAPNRLIDIAHSPAAFVSGKPEDAQRALVKRIFDLVVGFGLFVLFLPLFLIITVGIKLDSRGPIFFRQNRHGFNNQIIGVWKFRTMVPDEGAGRRGDILCQTVTNDPRITRFGRILRQTSLDELPQLFNVLKGNMSLVGPRPHALGMTAEETAVQSIVGDYAHRHQVKPGITGWAQIHGSRGPLETKDAVRQRVELDMEYINRSSFWLDVYILVMTAPCLLGDWDRVR